MAEDNQQNPDFQKALNALAEQQTKLLHQQETILRELADTNRKAKKDIWDRLGSIAPILSGTIIALGGTYFTVAYNEQQLKLQEVQTIEKFIPHLLGDEKSKRAAILAISSITNAKLAARVASIFASPGTVSALESIAENDTSSDKKALNGALAKALDNMAEAYRMDKKYEEAIVAYRKALSVQEQSYGDRSPQLVPGLNRIAEMYIIHKNYADAETLLKRSSEIQKLSYGSDSTQFAAQLRRLASLYREQGLDNKAQSLLSQANAIEQKVPATAGGGAVDLASETSEKNSEPTGSTSNTSMNNSAPLVGSGSLSASGNSSSTSISSSNIAGTGASASQSEKAHDPLAEPHLINVGVDASSKAHGAVSSDPSSRGNEPSRAAEGSKTTSEHSSFHSGSSSESHGNEGKLDESGRPEPGP